MVPIISDFTKSNSFFYKISEINPLQRLELLFFYLNRFNPVYLVALFGIVIFTTSPKELISQPSTVSQTPTTVEFTTAGSGTWTVPSGVKSITVEVWGAGGGGSTTGPAAGGGGGGYARSVLLVNPGDVISYEVGEGGGQGIDGSDSDWDNGTVLASGGNSGSGGTGGAGGTGNTGDVKFDGGSGGDSTICIITNAGGGGGGSALSDSDGGDGGDASCIFFSFFGAGGPGGSGEGDGGDGAAGGGVPGNGAVPGAGGGGKGVSGTTSGSGADGQITITYTTYSVDLTGGECWRSLTTPVQGATYADILAGLWTQGVTGSDSPTFGDANVLLWPDVTGVSDASWVAPADLDNVVPEGTGFLVSVFADDDFDGTDESFPKTISVSGVPYEADVSPAMNSNSDGWTFVGNPFGSSIDFDIVTKADLTNVAYVYDRNTGGPTNGNNGSWITTDGTVGDLANGEIAPFQGFFVQNSGASPDITFTESSKIAGTSDFFGKQTEVFSIRLHLEGEGLTSSAWLRFSDNGSTELTEGDALQLYPFGGEYAILATKKEDQLLDIHQVSLNASEILAIPVYIETSNSGTYQITATDLAMPPGLNLELHDLETGRTIAITPDFDYSFEINQSAKPRPDVNVSCDLDQEQLVQRLMPQPSKAIANDRFIIRVSTLQTDNNELPNNIALNQNYPNPFNPTTQITYQLPQQSDVRLEVFNLNGRQVATLVNDTVSAGTHTISFNASELSSGVYIYRLQAGSTVLVKKLTLIK